MAEDTDIVLRAILDVGTAEANLAKLEQRVNKMVNISDQRFARFGHTVTSEFQKLQKEYNQLLDIMGSKKDVGLTGQEQKELEDVNRQIRKLAESVEKLIPMYQQLREIMVQMPTVSPEGKITGLTVERSSAAQIKATVERDIADIRADLFADKLVELMNAAEPVVRESAARMRAELIAMLEDPQVSGQQLVRRLGEIKQATEDVVRAALMAQELPSGLTRAQARERVQEIQLDFDEKALLDRLDTLMSSANTLVAKRARLIREDLNSMTDIPVAIRAQEYDKLGQKIKELERVKAPVIVTAEQIARARELGLAIDGLKSRVALAFTIPDFGEDAKEQLRSLVSEAERLEIEALDPTQYDKAVSGVRTLIKQANEAIANQKRWLDTTEATTKAYEQMAVSQKRSAQQTRLGEQIAARLEDLMQSSIEEVRVGAAAIEERLRAIEETPITPKFDRTELERLDIELKALEERRPPEIVQAEQVAKTQALTTQFEKLRLAVEAALGDPNISDALREQLLTAKSESENVIRVQQDSKKVQQERLAVLKSFNQTSSQAIRNYQTEQKLLKAQADSLEDVGESVEEIAQAVDKLKPISDQIVAKEASNRLKDLRERFKELGSSSRQDVRNLAHSLNEVGNEAEEAFNKGESNAEEFNDRLKQLETTTNRMETAFGAKVPAAADRAGVSLWKLGNAIDRVGVRGAGNVIRITDALKALGPAAVGAGVAIGAIVLAITSVTRAMQTMASAAARAFAGFTKSALQVSKDIEVVDRQLGGFLQAPELGAAFRNLLLGKGFELGVDLTGDFSRVIVPLARDVDEVERAAEIAATLQHAFQETDEAIANAIKQAAGGHFRPLIERFGMTETEIQRIQNFQEETNEFTGVLTGLAEALQFRGLSISTFENTLQKMQGQLRILGKEVQIVFGEPVKNQIAEELASLFELVEARKDVLLQFFDDMGDTIAIVIDKVGEIGRALVGEITDEDIEDLGAQVELLGQKVADALGTIKDLLTTEDRSIIDILDSATGAAINLAEAINELLTVIEGYNRLTRDIKEFEIGGVSIAPLLDNLFKLRAMGPELEILKTIAGIPGKILAGDVGDKEIRGVAETLASTIPLFGNLINVIFEVRQQTIDLGEQIEEAKQGMDRGASATLRYTDAQRQAIDAGTQLARAQRDLQIEQLKYQEALEKITEAERKLAASRYEAEFDVQTRFARQQVDADRKASEDRMDLFARHRQRMLELTTRFTQANFEAGIAFDRKEEDNEISHQDKLDDIANDSYARKEDIEQKHLDRLAEIRRRFDLEAEEAIRKNDAVALLRARRRMKAELEEAEERRKQAVREVDETEQQKIDEANLWLQRAIRDNDLANQRKLEDNLLADKQAREQQVTQYNWELEQLQIERDRQRAVIDENRQRALDDLDHDFQLRQNELNIQYEAEYNILKTWKDAETQYLARISALQMQIIMRTRQMLMRTGYDPIYGLSGIPAGRTSARFRLGDPVAGGGFAGWRQYGGYVSPGNVYGINERNAEAFLATRAGVVAPREGLMMGLQPNVGGQTSIDNSRSVNVSDLSLVDPSMVSPIRRTMIRSMLTEEILKIGL